MIETRKQIVKDYIGRVNDAVNFINNNLDKELNLAIVSKVAHYSPFHFHRIFSSLVNEPLNVYINRKRIERSASMLVNHRERSISEIALESGFSNNASYSKAFKKFYGISPTEFRKRSPEFSKIGKVKSKNGQEALHFGTYICNIDNLKKWIKMNAKIEVKEMPKMDLAYVSHLGAFEQIGEAYERLMRWAGPQGLLGKPDSRAVTVYHDDPNITDISKVRQSASIILDKPVEVSGEISLMKIEKAKCATGIFEIAFSEFEKSWQSVFVWINENGYKTSGKDCFEIFHNDFNQHPEKKCIVEICVPVE